MLESIEPEYFNSEDFDCFDKTLADRVNVNLMALTQLQRFFSFQPHGKIISTVY
jgi:hypothetical protein